MKLKLFYQSLVFFVFCTFIQSENGEQADEIDKKIFFKNSHNVLENGRIISKPVALPIPADQVHKSSIQQDRNNGNKPKHIARGDILIPIEEIEQFDSKRIKRKIVAETNRYGQSNRWPGGVVPYEFISGIDYRVQQNVLTAIQHWHQRTCIRFEPYDSQRHYDIASKIIIEDSGSGCATFVGYRPSTGYISSYSVYLPLECPLGSAIHELGHVIGFYHEMARTDRDQEIILYFNAMSTSEATQYDIMPNPQPGYYGQPYDLGSIMHYYPTDVMAARDSRRTFLMGQRVALSFLDTKLANLGYHCGDSCDPKPVCYNEGYVNQYCQCTCPDGFYGEQCNSLQGYLPTSRVLPPEIIPSGSKEPKKPSTTSETSTSANVRWLEWSVWSNCSESCGSGVRVRTRLCSSTAIDGSSDPCSSLGGTSFEIESCQSQECKQADVITSCTFDLPDEKCSLNNKNNPKIQDGTKADQKQPITDHTRGDGKYLIIIGNKVRSDESQKFRLGPFSNSKDHCLQFWYSNHGQGAGRVTILRTGTNDNQQNDSFIFTGKDEDEIWKPIQHTISNDYDYELLFTYEANTTEYNHIAIDDISIVNGACVSKKINNQRRRKRRQVNAGCSRVIDLSTENTNGIITSPSYPNTYPANAQCYYYIRAPKSYRIILQFTDFNVPAYNTNTCGDSVEMRYYHIGQPGPKYCGSGANSNNLQFTSTKNTIMVVFRSDSSNGGRGFQAKASLAQ